MENQKVMRLITDKRCVHNKYSGASCRRSCSYSVAKSLAYIKLDFLCRHIGELPPLKSTLHVLGNSQIRGMSSLPHPMGVLISFLLQNQLVSIGPWHGLSHPT